MTVAVAAPRAGPGRVGRGLRELALTAGAVGGVLCLLFAALGAAAEVRPLVFTSGSMAPTIDTGDLAITRPVPLADVAPGDVVSVFDAHGLRVTHRVVAVDPGRHLVRLKGDANTVEDPRPYPVDRVDRVLASVPYGGYVLNWLAGPQGTLLFGAYLMFLVYVLWPRRRAAVPTAPATVPGPTVPIPTRRGPRGRSGRHAAPRGSRTTTGAALLVVAGLAAGGTAHPEPTAAAWNDSVPASAVLSSYTVPAPTITGCSVAGLSVPITFSTVSSPYPVTYAAEVAETGQTLTVSGSGSTRTVTYATLLQLIPGATHTVRITAALTGAPSWKSVAATQSVRLPLTLIPPLCL